MAGFHVLWANEFVPAAQETYRANHPEVILNPRDIRTIQPAEILSAIGKQTEDIDVLEGSPPCAPFSTAGRRHAGWGQVRLYSDTRQRVDDLFFEFVRILRGLQPKTFVAENVWGLVRGVAKGQFKTILKELKACGYVVEARLLDAQWLGVPQARKRIFFVGVRSDLGLAPAFPKPLPYRYSLREALPWITRVTGRTGPRFRRVESELHEPFNCISVSDPRQARYEVEAVRREPLGPEGRNPLDSERRHFTIGEIKRLCSFPPDFALTGNYDQQWERLGRAVPPLMMFHVARVIDKEILCKTK